MGCDGGTIPRRDELVRTKQKPEQKDKDSVRAFKWRHCSIRQSRLEKPVVACELGNLYSKASVLEVLINKETLPPTAEHIRNLKDVKMLNLTEVSSSAAERAAKGDGYIDTQVSEYMCPVVGLEMNGKYKFIFLWTCGCVFSEKALKMVKMTTHCHQCSTPFTQEDVIVINPGDEDLDLMQTRMEARRARAKALKKAKKSKSEETATSEEPEAKKRKVASERPAKSSERDGPSINMPNNGKLLDPAFAKSSASYSIAKDKQKTEVYKSLFTSHQTAINKPKAHWITYNPLFN